MPNSTIKNAKINPIVQIGGNSSNIIGTSYGAHTNPYSIGVNNNGITNTGIINAPVLKFFVNHESGNVHIDNMENESIIKVLPDGNIDIKGTRIPAIKLTKSLEFIKDEYPDVFADMILKGII